MADSSDKEHQLPVNNNSDDSDAESSEASSSDDSNDESSEASSKASKDSNNKRKASQKTSQTHRNNKKKKAEDQLSKLRVLVMVTDHELCEAKLFGKDGGIGEQFAKAVDSSWLVSCDFLDIHGLLEPGDLENVDGELVSTLNDPNWQPSLDTTNPKFDFEIMKVLQRDEVLEEDRKYHTPSFNHVVGIQIQEKLGSDAKVAYTKDSSLYKALKIDREQLAMFIKANFDVLYLGDDAFFYGKKAHPEGLARTFANTWYEFCSLDLRTRRFCVHLSPHGGFGNHNVQGIS